MLFVGLVLSLLLLGRAVMMTSLRYEGTAEDERIQRLYSLSTSDIGEQEEEES